MVLLYISLQSIGFILALAFASIGYGNQAVFDLSDYHYIFNRIILICLISPFLICLLLFRFEFLKEIFEKNNDNDNNDII